MVENGFKKLWGENREAFRRFLGGIGERKSSNYLG